MSATRLELSVEEPLASFVLSVELDLEVGSIGLHGPSGAGKTTLLEHVAGWRRAPRTTVRLGGRTLSDGRTFVPPERRGVGYVPQDVLLFPHLDVAGNLAVGKRRAGARHDALARAIDVLELGPLLGRPVDTLSGGERQRVALARALASGPELLLLDEPLGALDLPLRRRVLPYLVRLRESFATPLLLVSHDPTEVLALCDTVALLDQGRVEAVGAPGALLRGPGLGHASFENVLGGTVRACDGATADVELPGGARFRVPGAGATPGHALLFALRADDVLLSLRPIEGLSARNCVPARIEGLAERGGTTTLLVRPGERPEEAPALSVSLTPEARRELGLERGGRVWLVVKTHSCHRLDG